MRALRFFLIKHGCGSKFGSVFRTQNRGHFSNQNYEKREPINYFAWKIDCRVADSSTAILGACTLLIGLLAPQKKRLLVQMQALCLAGPLRASARVLRKRKIFQHVFGIRVLNSKELSGPPNSVHQRGRLAAPESGPVFGEAKPIVCASKSQCQVQQ